MRDTEKLRLGAKSQVFCLSEDFKREAEDYFFFPLSSVMRGGKQSKERTNKEKEKQKSGPKVNCQVKKTSSLHVCSADLKNLRTGVTHKKENVTKYLKKAGWTH